MAGEDKNSNTSQSNITTTVDDVADPNPCKRNLQPNKLVFFNESGERHEIYLPKGTFQRALDLLKAKNWDELSKFPVYTGQGYEEWD
ncbi:hypothetical protein TMatcc_008729 [Talaromyces marneffei ATCC 18224]|uniref:uncharacterized protein n=1 Tax=Talaromyces marneffei TaxID=37727 RepID=UPI0012A84F89|nr:uncharacterized protein EYB26_008052 [Talaromyces marneffei]KAE8550681.1 hypothetical protein EYB25_006909 [Talaromyces marneffei]QGA20350.1 hypothetical protein EYB26_008052 [Talaromyces marneffei]